MMSLGRTLIYTLKGLILLLNKLYGFVAMIVLFLTHAPLLLTSATWSRILWLPSFHLLKTFKISLQILRKTLNPLFFKRKASLTGFLLLPFELSGSASQLLFWAPWIHILLLIAPSLVFMTHPQGGPRGHETQLYKALMTENNFILLSYLLRLDKVFYSGLKKTSFSQF